MSHSEDFLLEIFTEELPPKVLMILGATLQQEMQKQLQKAQLSFSDAEFYVTPRRLALLIKDVATEQAPQTIERKGPAVSAAFDKDGKPTPACIGFARSCHTEPSALIKIKNPQGEWLGFKETLAGKSTSELLPDMVKLSLAALPIPKRMRWGENTETFIRPVHSVVLLLGKNIVETTLWGQPSGRLTYGHRFHAPKALKITQPKEYAPLLENKGYVIANVEQRKMRIVQQAKTIVQETLGAEAQILFDADLLNEVTHLVEWPIAICGHFETRFLTLPPPVLISAMQDHQRYFPITDAQGKLLANFAAIINIDSLDKKQVIAGNERVLRARLSDATFFYETDKKKSLAARVDSLKGIIFQAKLGSLYDKTQRLTQLACTLATPLKENEALITRAALLAKTDLTTEMVGEFPELQGVMGYYYALNDGEPTEVAQALVEYYHPRFSGDILPAARLDCILAIADRIDTLIGVFGVNQIPTGDKDPFGLRRAAIGVLRILIEKEIDVDLLPLLNAAASGYSHLENPETVPQLLRFMQERLKAWYQEQAITPDVYAAVAALNITRPWDMHRRIQAVQFFKTLPEAASLAMANKRVSNILAQYSEAIVATTINTSLLEEGPEKNLAQRLEEQRSRILPLYQSANYIAVLKELAHLRVPIDDFFDNVMVLDQDKSKRENRLLMLTQLRSLFLNIADIAHLST